MDICQEMINQSSIQQINEYGLLHLVDQLLKKAQGKHGTKTLKVARNLLTRSLSKQITIHLPPLVEGLDFGLSMIGAANTAAKQNDAVHPETKNSAIKLMDSIDKLKATFMEDMKYEDLCKTPESQCFCQAWLKFTRHYLKGQLEALLPLIAT